MHGHAVPSADERAAQARELARDADFEPLSDATSRPGGLPVSGWIRPLPGARCVHVYLEGDGHAWASRHRHSDDPTPVAPVGLRLAVADPFEATTVYLGRPCQYAHRELEEPGSACRPIHWTNARFGEAVIDALDQRLDAIAETQRPLRLRLVGFSGGGVLAVLLAARRDDIDSVVTIAAPLDLAAWTAQARVTPLLLSVDPMTRIEWLRSIRQDHFVGDSDAIVPAEVTRRFIRALGMEAPARLHTVSGQGHTGWSKIWAQEARALSDLCPP